MANQIRPETQRHSMRLRDYDYRRNGVYFVTICTYKKMKQFGAIIDGEMALSGLGKIAREDWCQIAHKRSNVELDRYVIMPNHLHGLLIITDWLEGSVGQPTESHSAKQPRISGGFAGRNHQPLQGRGQQTRVVRADWSSCRAS